ncbi:glycosyltransferase [Egbenema bharatensis]|uniref:glycosyltransferase n=1 Tax=Egbenema bharatensis TaxID=3463334 RepID=UPI003A89086F
MMLLLLSLFLILITGSIVFYLACAVFTWRFFVSSPSGGDLRSTPGVSILVPVCGLDEGAWENWTALCQQDYPDYEVLFGVVDPTDPAVPTLKQLAETFPDRVRLFVGLEPRGVNHKDSTLTYLLEEMRYEWIVFVDSDIQVSPDYIRTVTDPLADPQVGMVTCAFLGHNPQFMGAALASLGRCCEFIPSALIARAMDGGLRFAVGATIAMRQDALIAAGGLQLNRIGSDYNLGKRTAQAGYRVELSHYLLESDTGRETIRQLFQRELRWARTIRFNRGAIYYTIIFCYGVVFCLPLLLITGFQPWAVILTLITIAVRLMQAILSMVLLNCPKLLRWLWLLPLRDGLSLVIWALGALGSKVHWRGRWLRIEGDGLIKPLS